jgi:hypothetical protein
MRSLKIDLNLVFCKGASAKTGLPFIDDIIKITYPLNEQQVYQQDKSVHRVTAKQTPDPDFLELKEQLAELRMTIQVQQQQLQQTTAPPAPNPPATSFPPDFATTMMAAISSLRAEIAELRNLHLPISTPSSARKKVHITKEPHLYQQQAWLETYESMI